MDDAYDPVAHSVQMEEPGHRDQAEDGWSDISRAILDQQQKLPILHISVQTQPILETNKFDKTIR
jgi:hypothetical protein